MANDGRKPKQTFTADQIECFKQFQAWDKLPPQICDNMYETFIKDVSAGVAVNALHLYEQFKKQGVK